MTEEKSPGLFRRLRDAFSNRVTKEPRDPDQTRVWFPHQTQAGVAVNEDTALQNATAFACVRYISQSIAGLPWHAMKPAPGMGGEIAYGHNVDRILHIRPSPEWSPFQLKETLVNWALRYGNGVCEIVPDQFGRPFEMWPIHPDRVEFVRYQEDVTDAYGDVIKAGALAYEIDGNTVLSARRTFHLKGFGADGPVGINVVAYAAQTIGWARAASMFGASFFGNGMNIGGVVTNKLGMSKEALALQKAEFAALHRGPRHAFKTVHLDADTTFTPFASNLADAQFIELHHHLIEEVCRFFGGVPPHKVQHLLRSTFSNIEHQSIEVVTDVLLPWAIRLEQEADYKLLGDGKMWTKLNVAALMRGDMKSQAEALSIARQHGVVSADEWRALLDMSPLPNGAGGDKYLVQAAQIELADVGKNFGAANANAPPAKAAA
ncbi:MAG: phage portal protein [Pseudomonadota bacterium]